MKKSRDLFGNSRLFFYFYRQVGILKQKEK